MKSVRELRRKAAVRSLKTRPIYSTSEARANFAEALETVQIESSVIGFDRYGRPVAALVPVEAVYMLAEMGAQIDPAVRSKISRAARGFIGAVPNRVGKKLAAAPADKPAAKKAPKRKPPAKSRRR